MRWDSFCGDVFGVIVMLKSLLDLFWVCGDILFVLVSWGFFSFWFLVFYLLNVLWGCIYVDYVCEIVWEKFEIEIWYFVLCLKIVLWRIDFEFD